MLHFLGFGAKLFRQCAVAGNLVESVVHALPQVLLGDDDIRAPCYEHRAGGGRVAIVIHLVHFLVIVKIVMEFNKQKIIYNLYLY